MCVAWVRYVQCLSATELPHREEILNRRLQVVDDVLSTINTVTTDNHGQRLETYVVWLIVAEVALSLGHISVELLHYATS